MLHRACFRCFLVWLTIARLFFPHRTDRDRHHCVDDVGGEQGDMANLKTERTSVLIVDINIYFHSLPRNIQPHAWFKRWSFLLHRFPHIWQKKCHNYFNRIELKSELELKIARSSLVPYFRRVNERAPNEEPLEHTRSLLCSLLWRRAGRRTQGQIGVL